MDRQVKLFAGPLTALRPFCGVSPLVRVVMPAANSPYPVLPLGEDVHAALHAAYGTGDWLDAGPLLTSTDMAFAARASRGTALAYVEAAYAADGGWQCAALWRDGALVVKPAVLDATSMRGRAPSLWPVNIALKGLGVVALEGCDECAALGLPEWRSTADMLARAPAVPIGR